jgi:hypothetical protein
MHASGSRHTARGLHVSPPTVITARKKQSRHSTRDIRRRWRPSLLSRARLQYGGQTGVRCVAAWPQYSRQWGPRWPRKRLRAGCGTPSITAQRRWWPTCSDDARARSCCSAKRCGSRVAARAITQTAGAPTSAPASPSSPQAATSIRRKSPASLSTCAPASSAFIGLFMNRYECGLQI